METNKKKKEIIIGDKKFKISIESLPDRGDSKEFLFKILEPLEWSFIFGLSRTLIATKRLSTQEEIVEEIYRLAEPKLKSILTKEKLPTDYRYIFTTYDELQKIEEESQTQKLPEQKHVFSVSQKIRKRVRNLPDPTRPPLGYDEHKAFDRVFPYIRLPRFHPCLLYTSPSPRD